MVPLVVVLNLVVVAVGGHLIARHWPLRPRMAFAGGLALALPTLVAQGLMGRAYLLDATGASGAGALAIALLAGLWPAAVLLPLRWMDHRSLGLAHVVMVYLALVVFAALTFPALRFGLGLS